MKFITYILFIILISCSCGGQVVKETTSSDNKFYIDSQREKNDEKSVSKFGNWVEVGVECWGIVVLAVEGRKHIGAPVKCKIIKESKKGFECKTIEDARFYRNLGCDKLGVKKGDVWTESDGDLFLSKQAAIDTLKERNWYSEL